jgi:hypothetical protein
MVDTSLVKGKTGQHGGLGALDVNANEVDV